jgi:uncharacterized phage protein (TIGR01671 family)
LEEFKCRGWAERVKKMTYFEGGVITYATLDSGDAWGIFIPTKGPVYLCEYKVMDSMGREDKNDKDIYEKDIVYITIHLPQGDKTIKAIIKKQSGAFWYRGEGYTDCNWHHYNKEDIEVIGNLFENPELWEEEI